MEIVSNSIDRINPGSRRSVRYKMWKQSLHKWDEYVYNRRNDDKKVDAWSHRCLSQIKGNSAAYNCGGLYFKYFHDTITVIEQCPCPINVTGMEYVNQQWSRFDKQFDTLIMINPITLKYHSSIWDYFTKPGVSRAGYKGNLLNWIKPGGKIFLSFSDWHMYYDRLRFSVIDFIDSQIEKLANNRIECVYKDVGHSHTDTTNGNIKLELISYHT